MYRFIAFFYIIISTFSSPGTGNDVRGLWVVRYALSDTNEISEIIQTAELLNLTDLYIQVRALGIPFGQDKLDSDVTNFGRLVARARGKSIRVHAWLNILYIWGGKNLPQDKTHIFYRTEKSSLRSAWDDTVTGYGNLRAKGIEGYFIHPADNANKLDLKIFISDLIKNYPVDGIHLDYFRYPSLEYSFSPMGRTRFFQKYWFDPAVILKPYTYVKDDDLTEKFSYNTKIYKHFLRQELTGFLIEIKDYISQYQSEIELSVAVKPDIQIARNDYFQDWGHWLKEGICDRVVMMNYDTVMTNFQKNLQNDLGDKNNKNIIVGISTYNQAYNAVLERIKIVSDDNKGGFSIFSYNYLKENPVYLEKLIVALSEDN